MVMVGKAKQEETKQIVKGLASPQKKEASSHHHRFSLVIGPTLDPR